MAWSYDVSTDIYFYILPLPNAILPVHILGFPLLLPFALCFSSPKQREGKNGREHETTLYNLAVDRSQRK